MHRTKLFKDDYSKDREHITDFIRQLSISGLKYEIYRTKKAHTVAIPENNNYSAVVIWEE